MHAMVFPIRLTALCLVLRTSCVIAQDEWSYAPAERLLLDLITRDTASHAVCYLPEAYFFGRTDKHLGYFNLLKAGPRNHFVRPGTGEVYEVVQARGVPRLRRIDSTSHSGDNFRMITLKRKDTIYALGGYGFWDTKGHVTRFRPEKGEWEFLPTENPMPVSHWYQQYVPAEDALYYLGGTTREESARFRQHAYHDSVRKFDFRTRTWTTLGSLDPEHAALTRQWTVYAPRELNYTPFGILDLTGSPAVVDLPNNRVYLLKPDIVDKLTRFVSRFPTQALHVSLMNIYLRDTLHVITSMHDSLFHAAFRITPEDIDESSIKQLYIPVKERPQAIGSWKPALLLLAMALLAAMGVRLKRIGRRTPAQHTAGGIMEDKRPHNDRPTSPDDNAGHIQQGAAQGVRRFFQALPMAERELFHEMLALARKGRSIDMESINRILGLSRKDASIQKTRRSKAIKTINDTFAVCLNHTGDLIQRSREPEDRRIFTYRISPEHVDMLVGELPS
jgi:hypothetical protein